jgi:subtilisin family serine protease
MSMNGTSSPAFREESKGLMELDQESVDLLKYQTRRMNADTFAAHGFDGSGIRIAVLDAGFPEVDRSEAFVHLRNNGKIKLTYDFISRKENVYGHHWHGTATLSCIAGVIDSLHIGLATGSEFLLARVERSMTECFSEEENWLAAAEWADRNGANIISSSLGYTYQRYFNYQMDGNTSLVARAAKMAAAKGMLVVNAAGNEGDNSWHYIDTPADADSVLTVGGTDPHTDMHIYFSSYGPSSDGKLKPNVTAPAEVIAARGGKYARVSGTSFSTPLVAGFAACAWQSHPKWTSMELFDAIEKASHLYPYFDYVHGFGIPQADRIIYNEVPTAEPTFDFVIINNDIKLVLREQFSYPDAEEALGYKARRNFYYKVETKDGVMKKYLVLLADRKEMLHFFAEDFDPGDVLTVHFEGYTSSIDFPEINNDK